MKCSPFLRVTFSIQKVAYINAESALVSRKGKFSMPPEESDTLIGTAGPPAGGAVGGVVKKAMVACVEMLIATPSNVQPSDTCCWIFCCRRMIGSSKSC